MTASCPFCEPDPALLLSERALVCVLRDGFPVSPGHTLVVPRRHASSYFALTPEERRAMEAALLEARARLEVTHRPDGYNIGINEGAAAGQTVAHLHMHLIPRYRGDVEDPRGGVRWVVPDKARWWAPG